MIYSLQNDELLVKADSLGAELKSIKKKNDPDDIEYLWQLNPDIWERQAPLLFPLIGRLKDEEYTYGGKTYKTDIHGFARGKQFTTGIIAENEISFTLEEDADTLSQYPFHFKLVIKYTLKDNSIIKTHTVENKESVVMPYEVGGHEGYNLSFYPGERMEDYFIEFPEMKSVFTYTADKNVMINSDKKEINLKGSRIYLSPEVFKDDALILDEFATKTVRLRNIKNGRGIDVQFEDFKYLGLWTKYLRSDYVCIEPWSSLPDCNYLGKELVDKQDIRLLDGNCSETLKYVIWVI